MIDVWCRCTYIYIYTGAYIYRCLYTYTEGDAHTHTHTHHEATWSHGVSSLVQPRLRQKKALNHLQLSAAVSG